MTSEPRKILKEISEILNKITMTQSFVDLRYMDEFAELRALINRADEALIKEERKNKNESK